MTEEWKQHIITIRQDGSYIIKVDGFPYHVPNEGEYKGLYNEVKSFLFFNPGKVQLETVEVIPMEEIRNRALLSLNRQRKIIEYNGFMFNGIRWDSTQKDELRLNSAITMMDRLGLEAIPGWKANADTVITLTKDMALQVAVTMMQHYNACFNTEQEKIEELRVLNTEAEITEWLNTKLETGWIDSY